MSQVTLWSNHIHRSVAQANKSFDMGPFGHLASANSQRKSGKIISRMPKLRLARNDKKIDSRIIGRQ